MVQQNVTLELGKAGPKTFQEAGARNDNHSAGEMAGFFHLGWKPSQLGNVTIKNGPHSLTIPHVFTAMGTAWHKPAGEGIASITLNAGISADELWVKLMKKLQSNGWKRNPSLFRPRLSGKDAIRYFQDKENLGLGIAVDPYAIPDLETWLSVLNQRGSIFASFYLDGIEMIITFYRTIRGQERFDRNNIKLDFKEWGQYLIRVRFDTTRYEIRNAMLNEFLSEDYYGIEDYYSEEKIAARDEEEKITADLPTYWERFRKIRL